MLASICLLGALAAFAAAQTSTVTKCPNADWTINKKGETPCTVWAQLQAICTPGATVGPITNLTAPYRAPIGATATPCNCNYIAYNLMAACSWCQPGIFADQWYDEDEWKFGCTTYSADSLPPSISASVLALSLPPFVFQTDDGLFWSDAQASVANNKLAGVTSPTGVASSPTANPGPFGGDPTDGPFGGDPTDSPFGSDPTDSPFGGDPADSGDSFGGAVAAVGVVSAGLVVFLVFLLGTPCLGWVIALIVNCRRQARRKAIYGPVADYYARGGAPPPTALPPTAVQFAVVAAPVQPQTTFTSEKPVHYGTVAPQPPSEQQFSQPRYGQPQYGQPQSSQPQYGQKLFGGQPHPTPSPSPPPPLSSPPPPPSKLYALATPPPRTAQPNRF